MTAKMAAKPKTHAPTNSRLAQTPTTFNFAASGFFVLRTPLLPFDQFQQWGEGLQAAAASPTDLAQALAADRAVLRERLRALIAQPAIREAIFVASPDLAEYLDHWRREPESKRGLRVEGALVRYFTRMSGRATPFGLFAATSLGRVSAQTELAVAERARCERHTRLDMDYLFTLVDTLNRAAALRRTLRYRPNSSLYRVAGRVRYVEARLNGKTRSYHLVAVDDSEYLEATLGRAATGASFDELATPLVDDEITQADAEEYVEQLIGHQLLLPELALPVTGAEAINSLIEQFSASESCAGAAALLTQTRAELARLDAAGLGTQAEVYRAVARRLEGLPAQVELPRLFQVDTVRPPNETSLGEAVVQEIGAGVELLRSLFARPYEDELSRFRKAFVARYEGREAPLAEVLDDDLGIGYPAGGGQGNAPLLRGLALPGNSEYVTQWSAQQALLLNKLHAAWATNATELRLDERDLEALRVKDPLPLPNAISALCRVAAASVEALARGDFQVLIESAGGPSGATLLGRFCHADAALHAEVERHLRAEEAWQPEAVFAEVVHLPEGRIGNILARPVLRAYEIPYLGHSSAAQENQLTPDDLRVSVQGDRVVLRSERLQREVLPRLTSAHNWTRESSNVYKFLCALQQQGHMPGVAWQWGALEEAPFLPRVVAGRLVLARAQWSVNQAELLRLTAAQDDERFQAVQQWRAERKLPRYVVLAGGDNTLPVDLDNVLSVEAFAQIIKGRNGVRLQELWPAPDQLCAYGPEGAFVHELIVPFIKKEEGGRMKDEAENRKSFPPSSFLSRPSKRRFVPGSEWLYAKIYSGVVTADQVLREAVTPVAAAAVASGAAERWFFIRYADPEPHLRVRFNGTPMPLLTEVWPRLQAALEPLLQDGRVWRVQLDTYEREVERYGGDWGIVLAEQLFHADSVAVAELLELLDPNDAGMDERWRLALCGIDRLLADLGFDAAGKLKFFQRARKNFLAEFRADENLNEQLSERYRQERKRLEALLDPQRAAQRELALGLEVFERRSQRSAPLAAALHTAEREGRLTQPLSELAWSYAHMHVNRLLRSAQRAQELVLYDLLTRLYSAQAARQRQPQVAQAIAA